MHMKTEWHRYNLKRRVADLPPVNADVFEVKVMQQRAKMEQYDEFGFKRVHPRDHRRRANRRNNHFLVDRSADISPSRTMSPAGSIASRNTAFTLESSTIGSESEPSSYEIDDLISDNQSMAVSESSGSIDNDSGDEIYDSDEISTHPTEPSQLPITVCFYCGRKFDQVESNIRHLFKSHCLYIPERSFLVDVDGLLRYLSDAVVKDHMCLKCGFVAHNLEGIRQHSKEKGHCVVPYETIEERNLVKEFYNFDTTLESHADTGKKVAFADENDDICEHTVAQIDDSGTQLKLPNGVCLGNRKYARYYRQDIPDPADKPVSEGERTVATVYAKADEVNQLGQQLKRQEMKELGVIEMRSRSKALALKLKKANKLKYLRTNI